LIDASLILNVAPYRTGRVAYEPNSLAAAALSGRCERLRFICESHRAGQHPGRQGTRKPEKFAEHYAQATLFFDSQTPHEQAHIIGGFRSN